jgi:hypothetical protein
MWYCFTGLLKKTVVSLDRVIVEKYEVSIHLHCFDEVGMGRGDAVTSRKEQLLSQLAKRGGSGSSQRVPPATAPPHEERLAGNTHLGQTTSFN